MNPLSLLASAGPADDPDAMLSLLGAESGNQMPQQLQGPPLPAWWHNPVGAERIHPPELRAAPEPGVLDAVPGAVPGAIAGLRDHPQAVAEAMAGLLPPGAIALGARDVGRGVGGIADALRRGDIAGTRPGALEAGLGLAGMIPFLGGMARAAKPLVARAAPVINTGERFLPGARRELAAGDLVGRHTGFEDSLPLLGTQGAVTWPDHIRTRGDFDALIDRYVGRAMAGREGRMFYDNSGQQIFAATGGDAPLADAFAGALARTDPQTQMGRNARLAITAHNQAMAGDDILAGRFPEAMGGDISRYYYDGEPVAGDKIGPFLSANATWNPNLGHAFVNDGGNMAALEFGGGDMQRMWEGTPTAGQHNFARIVADEATRRLRKIDPSGGWDPKRAQAAVRAHINEAVDGTPIARAAFDFGDALRGNAARLTYETAPGLTADHLPEMHLADPAIRQAFHNNLVSAITDSQGRDLISHHLGLLTLPTEHGPGVFQGRVSPGSAAIVAAGQAPGGFKAGVDPATRALLDTAEATRGMLLGQDAAAWHKAIHDSGLLPKDSNAVEFRLGRPITDQEALDLTAAMHKASGSGFYSPIPTPTGFRFMNVADASNVDNKAFLKHANAAAQEVLSRPDNGTTFTRHPLFSDGSYIENDWRTQPDGEGYRRAISATGRPHLSAASAELLAALGPRVAAIQRDYARTHSWTVNPDRFLWERPGFRQVAGGLGAVGPARHPWLARPGAGPVGPTLESLLGSGAPPVGPPSLLGAP